MKTAILFFVSLSLVSCLETELRPLPLSRLTRGVNGKKAPSDCRYEKIGTWSDCDPNTGQQKRLLKLKTGRSMANCEPEKYIERQCKKNCRYSKGLWSECADGSKHRNDTLKEGSGAGCEPTRNVTKACKIDCNYQKSEWSVCENGVKTKTLTLHNESGARSGCEPSKVIRKQCGHRQNRKERTKARKPIGGSHDVNED